MSCMCGWHGLLVEWKNEVLHAGQSRRVAGPLARPATAQDVWQRGASAATDEDLGDWRRPGSAIGTDQLDAIAARSELCFLHALQAVRPCACIQMSKRCSKAVPNRAAVGSCPETRGKRMRNSALLIRYPTPCVRPLPAAGQGADQSGRGVGGLSTHRCQHRRHQYDT